MVNAKEHLPIYTPSRHISIQMKLCSCPTDVVSNIHSQFSSGLVSNIIMLHEVFQLVTYFNLFPVDAVNKFPAAGTLSVDNQINELS